MGEQYPPRAPAFSGGGIKSQRRSKGGYSNKILSRGKI